MHNVLEILSRGVQKFVLPRGVKKFVYFYTEV